MKTVKLVITGIFLPFMLHAQVGSAVSFNGTNSRVQISGISPASNTSLTIEAWIYTKSKTITNGYSEIIRQDRASGSIPDFLFSFQDESAISRILSFGLSTTMGYSELDVEIDTTEFMNIWVHVAATYDGSVMRVYQNGVLLGSAAKSGNIIYSPAEGRTNIGCASYFGSYWEYFEGYIDDVRIWTTERSASDIIETMNSTLSEDYYSSADSGLIAYWSFDEMEGTTAYDLSVSGNNGILVNTGYTENTSLPVELSVFFAETDIDNVVLNWSTVTESNNTGWEIERRQKPLNPPLKKGTDGFSKIGFVAGKGTTTEKQNYHFSDSKYSGVVEYRLKQIDTDGNFSFSNVLTVNLTPDNFSLSQNYPNPFNPSTAISYQLSADSKVRLVVFDLLGREVATLVNEEKLAGNYTANFNASHLTSGVYFYKITAGNFSSVKKMMLVK